MKSISLVNARQKGKVVQVAHDDTINRGEGAAFYLTKRDGVTRKRLFYAIEEWAALTDEQKKEAMDFTPRPTDRTREQADQVVSQIANANPLVRRAVVETLKNEILAQLGLTPEAIEQIKAAKGETNEEHDGARGKPKR